MIIIFRTWVQAQVERAHMAREGYPCGARSAFYDEEPMAAAYRLAERLNVLIQVVFYGS